MIEAKEEKEEEETQNIYIYTSCVRSVVKAPFVERVRICATPWIIYVHNIITFCTTLSIAMVLASVWKCLMYSGQFTKNRNKWIKKNNKSSTNNNNGIFIQTIYKLHSLNLNEGDALLLHLWCVFARNMYLRSSQPQFISAFSYEKWPTWVICDLLSEKLTKLPRQEKSNKLLTIQQIALSPTLIRLVNIFSFPYEDNKKNY